MLILSLGVANSAPGTYLIGFLWVPNECSDNLSKNALILLHFSEPKFSEFIFCNTQGIIIRNNKGRYVFSEIHVMYTVIYTVYIRGIQST